MEEQEEKSYISSDLLTLASETKGLVARKTWMNRYATKNKQIHLVAKDSVTLAMVDAKLLQVLSSVTRGL